MGQVRALGLPRVAPVTLDPPSRCRSGRAEELTSECAWPELTPTRAHCLGLDWPLPAARSRWGHMPGSVMAACTALCAPVPSAWSPALSPWGSGMSSTLLGEPCGHLWAVGPALSLELLLWTCPTFLGPQLLRPPGRCSASLSLQKHNELSRCRHGCPSVWRWLGAIAWPLQAAQAFLKQPCTGSRWLGAMGPWALPGPSLGPPSQSLLEIRGQLLCSWQGPVPFLSLGALGRVAAMVGVVLHPQ